MSQSVTIHKAILHGARDLRWEQEEVSLLTLGEHELYATTEASALSTGTDLANYEGRSREVPGAPGYPRWVGYNNAGIIHHCGAGVTKFAPGDRVFSPKPHQSGYVTHEEDLLVKIPAPVSAETASLAYLANLAYSALRQARYSAGDRVTVIGLGVIGLCTVALGCPLGADVTAIANAPARRDLALKVNAQRAFLPGEAPAESADIVVLTANTWAAYREALHVAAFGGRIAVLGFPGRAQPAPDFNPVDMQWLYGKQLKIIGAGHCPPAERAPQLERILHFAAAGQLPLERIITHRIPWRELPSAYELALQHDKTMAACVFHWQSRIQ
jgi:2-desacetyl-2-hydroxyethyl bacteriochlorophyllide A dehydrogenase